MPLLCLSPILSADELAAPENELGPAKERLALKVLNHFDLVPEHMELRPLYNPLRPSLECVSYSQKKTKELVDIGSIGVLSCVCGAQSLQPSCHLTLHGLYFVLQIQGKIQMWVDIFPEEKGFPPAPINVSPRKPDE